jgi:hypothetical protein
MGGLSLVSESPTSPSGLTSRPSCSLFVLMNEDDGQLYTLGLIEQLRDQCKSLWGASSELYFRVDKLLGQLANPNLHDINFNMQTRVELWDSYGNHIRWVVAATGNVAIGHAAFEAAVANWPNERFTLRQGALLIREHPEQPRR